MNDMMLGMIAMASFVAGVFFLHFWKTSRDRFFLFFAISFWLQSGERVIQALAEPLPKENGPLFYLIRLFAFSLILVAIIDKNWPRKKSEENTAIER